MNIGFRLSKRALSGVIGLLVATGLGTTDHARAAEGSGLNSLVLVDRLEYQTNEGDGLLQWDAQGWVGGDYNKLWVKTEGAYLFEENRVEEAEIQTLYSRAISPYWDLQVGARHDFAPGPSRTFGVIGIQGLAPHWFEIDAALFVSEHGDLEARVEAEYDFLITQRLVAQPRAELNFAFQDIAERGIGSGLSTAELGVRIRYEFEREVAPYVGISWSRAVGATANFARQEGENISSLSFVAGLRLWF